MIVVDASVAVTAVAAVGQEADRALRRIAAELAVAPHVLDLEVTSALRELLRRGEVTSGGARSGLRRLGMLSVRRVEHTPLIARCWELRHNMTPYDASYVALAEQTGATLLTSDARLTRAPGAKCEFELFRSPARS